MFFYDLVYHSKIRKKGAYHKPDGSSRSRVAVAAS